MEYNYKQRLVIENFKWVNSVVIFGMILAGVSVIAKLTGLTTIDVYTNIKLSSDESWKVLGILTIAHWYTSYLLKSSIDSLLSSEKEDKCLEVFQEITVSGGTALWITVRDSRILSLPYLPFPSCPRWMSKTLYPHSRIVSKDKNI